MRAGPIRQLLRKEYREVNQEGYGYSRFCDLLRGFERLAEPGDAAT